MKENDEDIKFKEAQRRSSLNYLRKMTFKDVVDWLSDMNETFKTHKVGTESRTPAQLASGIRLSIDCISELQSRNEYNFNKRSGERIIKETLSNIANNKDMLAHLANWDANVIRSVLSKLKTSNTTFEHEIDNVLNNISAPEQQVDAPKSQIVLKSALSGKQPATTLSERAEQKKSAKVRFADDKSAEDKSGHEIKPRGS